jgi:SAM-dependent methyltransferase
MQLAGIDLPSMRRSGIGDEGALVALDSRTAPAYAPDMGWPSQGKGFGHLPANRPSIEEEAAAVSYDPAVYFDEYYRTIRREALTDRDTIGPFVSELDSRYHFNAVENAIIRALARAEPIPPRGGLITAWEHVRRGQTRRLFDVGSGSGHWIAFFLEAGVAAEAAGCEISPRALGHLKRRFGDVGQVKLVAHDISEAPLPEAILGAGFDYVTAIGVMFHIVDDERWSRALAHLAAAAKPGGLLLVGGAFGEATRNVQFHGDDTRPLRDARPADGTYRVSKRLRSLADWQAAASLAGLEIVDLIRTESDPALVTPENDLLVLKRPSA